MSETNEEQDSVMNDAINEYYKLKAKYESENKKQSTKIINNANLSWNEKRNMFQQIKPKCINCKRPGGTIFSSKYNEDSLARELHAMCGITSQPCKLNILISVGKYELFPNVLNDLNDQIRAEKKNVINYKNKNIFGFISSEKILTLFNSLKEEIAENTSLLEFYLDEYLNIVDNKEEANTIDRDTTIIYDYINQIKDAIKNFNTTDNSQQVRDAVDIYNTKLVPLLEKIMKLKYKENYIWYNENDSTYHLIQQKYAINNIEFNVGEEKVVKYDMGM